MTKLRTLGQLSHRSVAILLHVGQVATPARMGSGTLV